MAKKQNAAPPVETPVETPVESPVETPETYEVDLFDTVPVVINGSMMSLPKGKQKVDKQIYDVLKDANLI